MAEQNGSRMEHAITAVRAAIDDGRMKPGVRYSVYQLAESLGVSRTPVREALLRLEEIGLIKFEARQGFQIQLPRPADIAEIFAVRLALELPAVRQVARHGGTGDIGAQLHRQQQLMRDAAAQADERTFVQHDQGLHDLILRAAGNERSRSIVKGLRETTRLLGASTTTARTLADTNAEHTPIVEALIAGRGDDAEAAMRSHLEITGKLLVTQALADGSGHSDPDEVDRVWHAAVY